jgi:L,D-transpeptidase ErfK/SrfK
MTLLLALGTVRAARAAVYELADDGSTQMVGEDTSLKTHYEDTLYDLGRQYGVGSEEIARANPDVDPWLPGEGTLIVVPGRVILPPGPRDGTPTTSSEHPCFWPPGLL